MNQYNEFKVNGKELTKLDSESRGFAIKVLGVIRHPLERFIFGDGQFKDNDEILLLKWLSGIPTEEIANADAELGRSYLRALTRLDGVLSGYAAWIINSAYLISSYERGNSLGTRSIHSLARFTLYGHFDSNILKLLEKDVNRTLLRDDVILLSFVTRNLRGILKGEYSATELENILAKSTFRTRIDEKQVSEAIVSLLQK